MSPKPLSFSKPLWRLYIVRPTLNNSLCKFVRPHKQLPIASLLITFYILLYIYLMFLLLFSWTMIMNAFLVLLALLGVAVAQAPG